MIFLLLVLRVIGSELFVNSQHVHSTSLLVWKDKVSLLWQLQP
jgi:hypothetical protein